MTTYRKLLCLFTAALLAGILAGCKNEPEQIPDSGIIASVTDASQETETPEGVEAAVLAPTQPEPETTAPEEVEEREEAKPEPEKKQTASSSGRKPAAVNIQFSAPVISKDPPKADPTPTPTPNPTPGLTVHTHTYEVYYTVEPCCAQEGYTRYRCTGCGDAYSADAVAKLSHTYEVTVVAPTTQSQGYTRYACTGHCNHFHANGSQDCGYSYITDYTDKLPESSGEAECSHSNTPSVIQEPTCSMEGIWKYTCHHCGMSYTEIIPPYAQHDWNLSTTFPADCCYEGYTLYFCSHCREEKHENVVPALGHAYTTRVVAPTATAQGYTEFTCTRCDKSFRDNYTDYVEETVTLHAHSYTGVKTEPTCMESGAITYSCACGHSYAEEIQPTGHSLTHTVVKPGCTSDGYTSHSCALCGHSYRDTPVAALDHAFSDWQTVTEPTESTEGMSRRSCARCGEQETKVLEKLHQHTFITIEYVKESCTSDGYMTKVCSCGERTTESVPAAHTWENRMQQEEGHYDVRICCHCGWSCSADCDYISAFAAHVESVDPATRYDHSYYDRATWVVDVPARFWKECSVCGVTES